MFKLLAEKLLAADMPPAWVDVITKCTEALEHDGSLSITQDQLRNSDPRRYATVTLKTNKGKRALNLFGDFGVEGDTYVGGNTIYNGVSGTSMAFRNDSGETAPAGGVMEIRGYGKKVDGTRYLKIRKPTATTGAAGVNTYPRVHAVNGDKPIADGEFGVCSTTGFSMALCNGAPAYGQGWGAKPDQWTLESGRSGFETQGAAEPEGSTLVFQEKLVLAMGIVITADIAQGMSGTVKIRDASSADMGYEVTAYDDLLLATKNTPVGSRVDLEYRNGKWWISGGDKCPT